MITPEHLLHAQVLRDNTPRSAVILSNDFIFSPVNLAGRIRVCSYDGWLWSYGLAYYEPCEFRKNFQLVGDIYKGINSYKITHFVTADPDPKFADKRFNFEPVVEMPRLNLYRVLPPIAEKTE